MLTVYIVPACSYALNWMLIWMKRPRWHDWGWTCGFQLSLKNMRSGCPWRLISSPDWWNLCQLCGWKLVWAFKEISRFWFTLWNVHDVIINLFGKSQVDFHLNGFTGTSEVISVSGYSSIVVVSRELQFHTWFQTVYSLYLLRNYWLMRCCRYLEQSKIDYIHKHTEFILRVIRLRHNCIHFKELGQT